MSATDAQSESGRLPSLDGLRALSIGLVVVGHAVATMPPLPRALAPMLLVLGNAEIGVAFFFVISGFLITHLLLAERRATGRISLYNFYVRRVTRIIPAYYFYIAVIALLASLGMVATRPRELAAAALFLWNYIPWTSGWWLGQSWSLCIEEQFYLLWPITLLTVGPRGALRLAAGIIALEPAIRVASYFLFPAYRGRIPVMLHTRADILMFGCILALAREKIPLRNFIDRSCTSLNVALAALFVFVVDPMLSAHFRGAYFLPLGFTLDGISIAMIVNWLMSHAVSPVGRVFNSRPLVWLGGISYGLYLWQQLFLTPLNRTFTGRFPLNIGCAIAAAAASFYFLERPILRRRSRLLRLTASARAVNSAALSASSSGS